MIETESLITRARTDMVPLPIVLDADVLHRNVDYCLRTGYTPRVLEAASTSYTLVTGVVVFATSTKSPGGCLRTVIASRVRART